MNKKQQFILALTLISIILIVIFTPRYKITWVDSKNFIRTEQTSSLYKRSHGKECLHWDKIALYAGSLLAGCGIALFLSRRRRDG